MLIVAIGLGAVALVACLLAHRERRARAQLAAELNHVTHHDHLTGLPNRSVLEPWLEDCLASSRRHSAHAAALFIDLDQFRAVNDTHGPEVGDNLMKAVVARLRTVLRPGDKLVRRGGTQFVMLCPDIPGFSAAEKLAGRVISALHTPFQIKQDLITMSACVGVTVTDDRFSDVHSVLLDAEVALYKAKDDGPGSVAMFDQSMQARLTPANAERRLTEALERGEFQLLYMPIISLETNRMTGVEALIRWKHPDRGMVSPGEFLPAMDETGLIVPVGTWVLEEACRQARQWQARYPDLEPIEMTVNISARQVAQADFIDVLSGAVRSTADSPTPRLCLEVTEGALKYDLDAAWTMLRQTKDLGVSLALDDFGTGSSSIQSIRTFRCDVLKIDNAFIDGVGQATEDTAIVKHMIALANDLGMIAVAEGVETPVQLAELRRLKCHRAQGYLFGHPVPPEIIDDMLYDISLTRTQQPPADPLPQRDLRSTTEPSEVLLPAAETPPAPNGDIPAQSPAAWPDGQTGAPTPTRTPAPLADAPAGDDDDERQPLAARTAPIHREAPRPHEPQPLMAARRKPGGSATPAGPVVPPLGKGPRRRSELTR